MEPIELDKTDLALLDQLQTDAGLSNLALAERLALTPPTCLRRVRRLESLGLIERRVALLNPQRLGALLGHGLQAMVEVSLDRQDSQALEAFEGRCVADAAVSLCWRVASGPDFVLMVQMRDMPAYSALVQRLFTQDANVRNVRAFFCTRQAKWAPRVSLG